MDMALYSLVKNKIKETPKNQVDKVGNYEICFVNSESEATVSDTLYFVLGDFSISDKFIVGGKGVVSVIFNGEYIDYGILNGNMFLNKFDSVRNYERLSLISNDGSMINVENTANTPILDFSIVGQNNISYVNNIVLSNADDSMTRTIEINDYFIGTNSGANKLDLITGEYNKDYVISVIDDNITWMNSRLYGDYRQFKCDKYVNYKPEFLNYSVLYDYNVCMPLIGDNTVVKSDGGFAIADGDRNRRCIYIENSVLYIRMEEQFFIDNKPSNMNYNAFLQQYLTEHPIEFAVKKVNPTIETKLSIANEQPINAYEGGTKISINCKDESYPIVNVELPIHKGVENL